jgi:hypothetical protein
MSPGSAMTALVNDKVAKLLPRLASNHDGEVVATARAIEKLKSDSACSGASMKANEPMP